MGSRFYIETVAVLGAGVMGAQIAAHFVNAGMKAILFDLPTKEGDKNALVHQALAELKNLHPAPLAEPSWIDTIVPANYEEDLSKLKQCDLVIEAIAERLDWKKDLYNKISPFLGEHTVVVSNTSGLNITELAMGFPETQRRRFCGMHFFNPPRYMSLVELIPHASTDSALLEGLESFLVSYLGKNIIYAKDTPNFIGNRIGVFSLLSTLKHAENFGLSPDVVDALTGPLIGRPKSATFRTLDIVGLDTFAHVVNTMAKDLPEDPWHSLYHMPAWLNVLIQKGALGQKTKMGIYRKHKDEIQVINVKEGEYRLSNPKLPQELLKILAHKSPAERFALLKTSLLPEAKFLTACFKDLFQYCAFHLENIADTARDVDLALRWGYGWEQGPFEFWQATDWQEIALWLAEEIKLSNTLSDAPLPEWVNAVGENGVYSDQGAFSPSKKTYVSRSTLPVYRRQLFPDKLLAETLNEGKTIFETSDVRLWTMDDDIAILNFKTKKNTITEGVLDGILKAIETVEEAFLGLVLWQRTSLDFSFGANLKMVIEALQTRQIDRLSNVAAKFQQTALALRYAKVPTVAAVRGLVLGGACELMMHCARTVAAFESYIGLVEVGVGILPAGAGSKEMALRATKEAKGGDSFPFLQTYFRNIGMAEVSNNAVQAKRLGYLKESDVILMHPQEILYVAKQQVLALNIANYCPPRPEKIMAQGKSGWATLQVGLINMKEGGFISEHDYEIGCHIARVMCGGDVESGTLVPEEWFLSLEHQAFMTLLNTKKTQDRIAYMLENGKALRN